MPGQGHIPRLRPIDRGCQDAIRPIVEEDTPLGAGAVQGGQKRRTQDEAVQERFEFHNRIGLILRCRELVRQVARVGRRTQNVRSLSHPPPVHPNGLIGQTGVSFHSLLRDSRRRESDYLKKSSGDGVDPATVRAPGQVRPGHGPPTLRRRCVCRSAGEGPSSEP